VNAFASNSYQVSFFMFLGFSPSRVMLSLTRSGSNGVHPNLPPAEIDDTIKLLNIELDCRHLHVDLTLIPIVAQWADML